MWLQGSNLISRPATRDGCHSCPGHDNYSVFIILGPGEKAIEKLGSNSKITPWQEGWLGWAGSSSTVVTQRNPRDPESLLGTSSWQKQQRAHLSPLTRQGLGAAAPDSGKPIIFRTKAKFFGQKPAAKNEKNIFFVFIKRKNWMHSD